MDNDKTALKTLIDSGEFLNRLNVDRKTSDLVFDARTLKALYELMNRESIDYVDFPISSGKESVVFKAYMKGKPVVIKVYKLSTLKFSTIGQYIEGDYRFHKESRNRSRVVYLWAKKEYTNLVALFREGIHCPRPIAFHKNLLLMSYIGDARRPAPLLKDYNGDLEPVFRQVMEEMRTMHSRSRIVHADLSEYNILVYRKKPYFIDLAQGVTVEHKSAEYFLDRDVVNICRFFNRHDVDCDPEEVKKHLDDPPADQAESGKP